MTRVAKFDLVLVATGIITAVVTVAAAHLAVDALRSWEASRCKDEPALGIECPGRLYVTRVTERGQEFWCRCVEGKR